MRGVSRTKIQERYPRTGIHKRAGRIVQVPSRPPKFNTWLAMPLTAFVGRFRRLRREMHRKPARAEYVRGVLVSGDAALAKELGIS